MPKGRFLGVLAHGRMMAAQALLRSQMLVPGSPGWSQSCSSSSRARPTASSSPPSGGCSPDLKALHGPPPSHSITPGQLLHPAWHLAHLLCLTTCSLPICQPARCTFKPRVSNWDSGCLPILQGTCVDCLSPMSLPAPGRCISALSDLPTKQTVSQYPSRRVVSNQAPVRGQN